MSLDRYKKMLNNVTGKWQIQIPEKEKGSIEYGIDYFICVNLPTTAHHVRDTNYRGGGWGGMEICAPLEQLLGLGIDF